MFTSSYRQIHTWVLREAESRACATRGLSLKAHIPFPSIQPHRQSFIVHPRKQWNSDTSDLQFASPVLILHISCSCWNRNHWKSRCQNQHSCFLANQEKVTHCIPSFNFMAVLCQASLVPRGVRESLSTLFWTHGIQGQVSYTRLMWQPGLSSVGILP